MPFHLAFSVHKFVNSVGADAGIAAIGGLAILVLLYFAQAREMAALREQSDEASQRAHQLEGQLAQLTQAVRQPAAGGVRPQPVAAPPPGAARAQLVNPLAAAAAGASGAAQLAQPAVGAPVGLAAPALASATKLIPTPVAVPASPAIAAARSPAPVAAAAPVHAATVGVPVATPAAARGAAAAGNAAAGSAFAPAAATAAGGAAASAVATPAAGGPTSSPPATGGVATATAPPPPPPATAAGGANGAGARTGAPLDGPALPRVEIRPGAASGGPRPPALPPLPGRRRSNSRRVVAAIVTALVLVGVVAALVIATSGSDTPSRTTSPSTPTSNATVPHNTKPAPPPFNPSSVSVTVLNGTATSGLARRVATKLTGIGYKQGAVPQTAADQTHTATVVGFMPGHQSDAVQVAKALKLSTAAVQPVDQAARTLACPQSTACSTTVVVTVGSDLATIQ